jgi:hypothetical protein
MQTSLREASTQLIRRFKAAETSSPIAIQDHKLDALQLGRRFKSTETGGYSRRPPNRSSFN